MRLCLPRRVSRGNGKRPSTPTPVQAARVLQEPLASLVFEHVDVAGYCPCCSDFDDFDLHVCDEMDEDRWCAVCGYEVDCAAPNVAAFHYFPIGVSLGLAAMVPWGCSNRGLLSAPIASFA